LQEVRVVRSDVALGRFEVLEPLDDLNVLEAVEVVEERDERRDFEVLREVLVNVV